LKKGVTVGDIWREKSSDAIARVSTRSAFSNSARRSVVKRTRRKKAYSTVTGKMIMETTTPTTALGFSESTISLLMICVKLFMGL